MARRVTRQVELMKSDTSIVIKIDAPRQDPALVDGTPLLFRLPVSVVQTCRRWSRFLSGAGWPPKDQRSVLVGAKCLNPSRYQDELRNISGRFKLQGKRRKRQQVITDVGDQQ